LSLRIWLTRNFFENIDKNIRDWWHRLRQFFWSTTTAKLCEGVSFWQFLLFLLIIWYLSSWWRISNHLKSIDDSIWDWRATLRQISLLFNLSSRWWVSYSL
jgi:hypothetical protein